VVKHLGATDTTFLPGSSVAPPDGGRFSMPSTRAKAPAAGKPATGRPPLKNPLRTPRSGLRRRVPSPHAERQLGSRISYPGAAHLVQLAHHPRAARPHRLPAAAAAPASIPHLPTEMTTKASASEIGRRAVTRQFSRHKDNRASLTGPTGRTMRSARLFSGGRLSARCVAIRLYSHRSGTHPRPALWPRHLAH
jgi:hypothetical protein